MQAVEERMLWGGGRNTLSAGRSYFGEMKEAEKVSKTFEKVLDKGG